MLDGAQEYSDRYMLHYDTWCKEQIGFTPEDYQAEAAETLLRDKFISIKSGTTTGKTAFDATVGLWFFTTRAESNVIMTAPTGHQLDDLLMSEIRTWKSRIKLDMLRDAIIILSNRIFIEGHREWYMVPRTIPKDSSDKLGDVISGFHAPHLLFLIDEASGVPDAVFSGMEGSMIQKNCFCALTGNPTRPVGYFFDSHNKNKARWAQRTFSSLNSRFVESDYVDRMREIHGEDSDWFRVKVLGEFPQGSFQAIATIDTLNELFTRHKDFPLEEAAKMGTLVAGLDPAGGRGDYSILTFRRGFYIYPPIRIKALDTVPLMNQVHKLMLKWGAKELYIDYLGLGIPIYDIMRRKSGYRTYKMIANARANDSDGYGNLRAELYSQIRDNIDDFILPFHERYVQELPEITINPHPTTEKMMVIKKADLKPRLGFSPDYSDSLMTSTLRHFSTACSSTFSIKSYVTCNKQLNVPSSFVRI